MSNQREADLRERLVRLGALLYAKDLIAGGDGNLSVRLDAQRLLITPSGLGKGWLTPADLVIIDLDGNLLEGANDRLPSSEYRLHVQVYRCRPDVQAVVHAHPPTVVAATLAGISLSEPLLPEARLSLGPVPTAPYGLTGTPELAASIEALIADHDALALAYHGALTVGPTAEYAYMAMEQLEHCAKILLAARQFGGAQPLPPQRIAELDAIRERWRTAAFATVSVDQSIL